MLCLAHKIPDRLADSKTTMAMRRRDRSCCYSRFRSVVSSTSKPACSATAINSPLPSLGQPRSKADSIACSGSA